MSGMTNLQFLARNVHEWPSFAVAVIWQDNNPVWLTYPDIEPDTTATFYQDWLAERERIQEKPKWDIAPEWANWLGQCASGRWEWYGDKPIPDDEGPFWDHGLSEAEWAWRIGEVLGDWKLTLEQRPETKLEEKTMKHKFKVGDKVEVVTGGYGCALQEIGTVTTITELGFYDNTLGYRAANLKNNPFDDFIGEESFELVQNQPEQQATTELDRQHPAAAQAAHPESITPIIDFEQKEQPTQVQSRFKSAPAILSAGIKHMEDRAALRDSPQGERSMTAAVAAFNALEGTNLTEVQGWRFMCVLKHARAAKGNLNIDDYEDAAAYWALAAEAAQQ